MNNKIEQHGFSVVTKVLSHLEVVNLLDVLGSVAGPARRVSLAAPVVAELAKSERLVELVRPHVCSAPRPVRAIYFDKSAKANWRVAWHQDLTLAVQEQVDVPGFAPWSMKDGIPHVQAPVELLQQMLTLRIHLDDCGETTGALRVLPGTHRLGRLSSERIQELRRQYKEVICSAGGGDVMLMRPLLLHASAKSQGQDHRRVLHIEYAGFELPGGLRWAAAH